MEAKIHRLEVVPHPNADRLELAVVGGYRAVVVKGKYRSGDLAAYIPTDALCPEPVIEALGLEGRLAGPKKNRVKAIRLRGELSEGLVFPLTAEPLAGRDLAEGDDVTEELGIEKYEPPVPIHMSGQVAAARGRTLGYKIEALKKYPDAFADGDEVAVTEKLHGTWCCLGVGEDDEPLVTSKGLSGKGLIFDRDAEANAKNLYVRAWAAHEREVREIAERLRKDAGTGDAGALPVYVLGEIFGRGVQDLHYGQPNPAFRVFDVYMGRPGEGKYLAWEDLARAAEPLPTVPLLYEGPYSAAVVADFTDGPTTAHDQAGHMREGVVIRPLRREQVRPEMGRLIAKSVSGDYLTRRGGTEYN